MVSEAGYRRIFFEYIVSFDYININSPNLLDIKNREEMKTKKIVKNSLIIIGIFKIWQSVRRSSLIRIQRCNQIQNVYLG